MGCIRPADTRNFRVVIRNRADREIQLQISMEGVSYGNWQYSEKTLASGVGRVVDVNVAGNKSILRPEELLGGLIIRAKIQHLGCSRVPHEEYHRIPVYVRFLPTNE